MAVKKNTSLIIAMAIPILMIVLVAVSIYLPGLFAPAPQFDFLYVSGDDYYAGHQYVVENGKLAKRDVKYPEHYTPGVARLFVHDVSTNNSKEIFFEEAQKFALDASVKSPDGYEVAYGSTESGFFPLFFSDGRDYNTMYLKGHNASKKLNLQVSSDERYYSYRERARFLGWVGRRPHG